MSITHLPAEILLDIINRVLNTPTDNFATSLAWTWDARNGANPWDIDLREPKVWNTPEGSTIYGLVTLISLSRTNRYFRQLCNPLVYSRVDLVNLRDYQLAMRHQKFVQYLKIKIKINSNSPSISITPDKVFSILEACKGINTLVICYECHADRTKARQSPAPISHKIVSMLKAGQLRTLAISVHNLGIFETVEEETTIGPLSVLWEIKDQEIKLDENQQVHMAIFRSDMPKYSINQERPPNDYYSDVFGSLTPYFPPANLVSLQFMGGGGVHSPWVPDLILHCPRLRYLLVSTCGDDIGLPPVTRTPGWSRREDALWRRRAPLEEFQIEHMLEWEIIAMGTIPARTVIITSTFSHDLQNTFLKDPEIFPCMELLRYEFVDDEPLDDEGIRSKFHEVLKRRDVEWRTDAVYRYSKKSPW